MLFLVTLIVLLTERFFHWGRLRQWYWLERWFAWMESRGPLSAVRVLLLLLVPVLPVLFLQWMLKDVFFHLPGLLFAILVVLYCMGPENFWESFCSGKFSAGREGESDTVDARLFPAIHESVLGVLFWFWLLGPAGAVLYRVAIQASAQGSRPASAGRFLDWMNWLPARFFSFLFALAGQFAATFSCWAKRMREMPHPGGATVLLTECGRAALGAAGGVSGKEALALLDRVLVITLVLLGLVVLALD